MFLCLEDQVLLLLRQRLPVLQLGLLLAVGVDKGKVEMSWEVMGEERMLVECPKSNP